MLAGKLLEHAHIALVPMRRMLEAAVKLSVAIDHPAYDCLYLALAETSGCDFVTADPRLCARVRAHDLRVRTFSLFDILDDVGIRKDP